MSSTCENNIKQCINYKINVCFFYRRAGSFSIVFKRNVSFLVQDMTAHCMTETFQASCNDDQVILMQTARYGRMSLGRCVKTDFGFVGCYADVLDLADRRCSGRRRCSIKVPDPLFENTKACNEEFKSYLETTYTCLPGQ